MRSPIPAAGHAFASDNYAGIAPEIMHAIVAANTGAAPSYGADPWTAEAMRLFRSHFGEQAEVMFAFNGTGANVLGLQLMLRPYECVVCTASAHINADEAGAPERFLGSKLVDVPAPEGKLTPELLAAAATGAGDPHSVQPRVVSVAQSTELGTLYTVRELRALADWAHAHDMLLHLDGARLANAAAALGVGLGELGGPAGVDVLSFGGTKNGAMGAEAVVVLNPQVARGARYLHKQSMQLASKMRFVSAQFIALLEGDLWHRNAAHANAMAARLDERARGIEGVRLAAPTRVNAVFASLPRPVITALQAEFPFYLWDEATDQVRWMTSFATTTADVDAFADRVQELMSGR